MSTRTVVEKIGRTIVSQFHYGMYVVGIGIITYGAVLPPSLFRMSLIGGIAIVVVPRWYQVVSRPSDII